MRDPDRIPLVLAAVERAWRRSPDLRLGQLIENATRGAGDVFSVEDGALVRLLGVDLTEEERRFVEEEPRRRRSGWEEAADRMFQSSGDPVRLLRALRDALGGTEGR